MSIVKVALSGTILVGGLFASSEKLLSMMPEPTVIRIPYEKPEERYADLVREIAPKYGVPIEVVAVLLLKEHDDSRYPYRFEPGQMSRVTRMSNNDSTRRLLASSYCPLQIMGWHTFEAGDEPLDLLKPRTCVEYGMRIISKCLERWKTKGKSEQYYNAFKCYNGADSYARDAMSKLTDILIRRLN